MDPLPDYGELIQVRRERKQDYIESESEVVWFPTLENLPFWNLRGCKQKKIDEHSFFIHWLPSPCRFQLFRMPDSFEFLDVWGRLCVALATIRRNSETHDRRCPVDRKTMSLYWQTRQCHPEQDVSTRDYGLVSYLSIKNKTNKTSFIFFIFLLSRY